MMVEGDQLLEQLQKKRAHNCMHMLLCVCEEGLTLYQKVIDIVTPPFGIDSITCHLQRGLNKTRHS